MHIENSDRLTMAAAISANDDDERTPLDVVIALAKKKLAVSPRVACEVLDLGNTPNSTS